MTTIKATLHIFKKVLDESAERQQRLTSLYEALWETLRGELDDTPDEPNNKRAKSDNDVNELLGVLQSSLLSMITSARNDLTILEPKAVEELRDSGKSALSVLEENDPATACRTHIWTEARNWKRKCTHAGEDLQKWPLYMTQGAH